MGVVKTWNSIARASVKTFDGIAVASVKTINGLDATTGGGATYTLQETFGADSSDSPSFADNSARTYLSSEVVVTGNYTITRIELRMKRVTAGGSAPDIVCEIRADAGTKPDASPLATSTNTIVSADVSTSQGWIAFDFTGLAVTNGTHYYIGIKASSTNAAEYYTCRSGAIASGDVQQSAAGTTTWGATGTRMWYQRTYVSP